MTFERMALELWIMERILNVWNPLNPSVSCHGSCCYPDQPAGLGELLTEEQEPVPLAYLSQRGVLFRTGGDPGSHHEHITRHGVGQRR